MPVSKFTNDLRDKSADEVAEILKYVLDNHDDSAKLVNDIIGDMDNREDFNEIMDKDERFDY